MKIEQVFEDNDFCTIVGEAYSGGNLLEKAISIPYSIFTFKEALEIMRGVLQALAYLDSKDIVHRDIKLQNIMIKYDDGSYHCGLIDFGFAHVWKNDQKRPIYGTVGFYAPEILQQKNFDCRSDVFSAGIVFFNLLAGRHAFSYKDHKKDLLEKNAIGKIDFDYLNEEHLPPIPPQVVDLLKRMLTVKLEDRIRAADALKHEAFNLLSIKYDVVRPKNSSPGSSYKIIEEEYAWLNNQQRVPSH